jgi:coproporphyrinogen III oxidase-like Fe-S oxidoreductase
VDGGIVGLGAGAGTILEGAESVNHRDVARYIGDLRENRFSVVHDCHSTHKQARERYVLFRILFLNRSLAGFRGIVARRFEEYYGEPIGSYYDKVIEDMKQRAYVELFGERIVFTELLWNMLAGLEIGTPSIL